MTWFTRHHFIPVLLLIFLGILVAGLLAYLAYDRYLVPVRSLPPNSVTYAIRLVEEKRPDGRLVRYFVLDTTNRTSQTLYNCTVSLNSAGEKQVYSGYLRSYQLRDCRPLASTQANLDCQLQNKWREWTQSVAYKTILRLPPGQTSVVPMDSFYSGPNSSSTRFTAKYRFSDIYSYSLLCKNSPGQKVSHTAQK